MPPTAETIESPSRPPPASTTSICASRVAIPTAVAATVPTAT